MKRKSQWWIVVGMVVVVAALGGLFSGCCLLYRVNCDEVCEEHGECGRRAWRGGDRGAQCYIRGGEDCRQSARCREEGLCDYVPEINKSRCIALSDETCVGRRECEEEGVCQASRNGCVVSELGCQRSRACAEEGRCVVGGGGCGVPHSPLRSTCERACRAQGACTERDGRCVATSQESCRNSSDCHRQGRCSLDEAAERCVAADDRDCEGAFDCVHNGWCRVAPGSDRCTGYGPLCEEQCQLRGWCEFVEGICTVTEEKHCEESIACVVSGRCAWKGIRPGRLCTATEQGCADSLECRAYGRCELASRFGLPHCSDGERSSRINGCMDEECLESGRCLMRRPGVCETPEEAGLPPDVLQ